MSDHKFTARPVQSDVERPHVTLRIYVNGASAGLLTMRADEAVEFVDRITLGNPAAKEAKRDEID